eukprot:15121648-Alexandrium_andersonii.AAC.1
MLGALGQQAESASMRVKASNSARKRLNTPEAAAKKQRPTTSKNAHNCPMLRRAAFGGIKLPTTV